MKVLTLISMVLVVFGVGESSGSDCDIFCSSLDSFHSTGCIDKLRYHIQHELQASMVYLSMGSYFARTDVNRPGFAKFFFESASEERDHALKMIRYLNMRGDDEIDYSRHLEVQKSAWENPQEALQEAIKLEKTVTSAINDIISFCSADPDLTDFLTTEFMREQLVGTKTLVNLHNKLQRLRLSHPNVGEFIFDKELGKSAEDAMKIMA